MIWWRNGCYRNKSMHLIWGSVENQCKFTICVWLCVKSGLVTFYSGTSGYYNNELRSLSNREHLQAFVWETILCLLQEQPIRTQLLGLG